MSSIVKILMKIRVFLIIFAILVVGLVLYQTINNVTESSRNVTLFSKSLAYVLYDPVNKMDIRSIKKVIRGFQSSHENIIFCVKVDDIIVSNLLENCIGDYVEYTVPLSERKIFIHTEDRTLVFSIIKGVLLVVVVLFIFYLFFSQIRCVLSRMIDDFQNLLGKGEFNFQEFENISFSLDQASLNRDEFIKLKTESNISNQVAHDIKSPLAALEIVMEDIRNLPDDSRDLILHAINRIQNIANELSSEKVLGGINDDFICLVSIALKKVITEKTIEFQEDKSLKIKFVDHTDSMIFIKLNEYVLCRMISNLINNSVEAAKDDNVNISIEVTANENVVFLTIQDDGIGFPLELLEKGICRGLSIGKDSGQGLGLDYAVQELAKVGGDIKLSNSSVGAKAVIEVPFSKEPKWFSGSLKLENIDTIVVIDDDISIHDLWKKRLRSFDINLLCYSEFETNKIKKELNNEKAFFLIDYDLRKSVKGTDIILKENLKERSLLVTSNYDMEEVLSICLKQEISILPKQLISHLKI